MPDVSWFFVAFAAFFAGRLTMWWQQHRLIVRCVREVEEMLEGIPEEMDRSVLIRALGMLSALNRGEA